MQFCDFANTNPRSSKMKQASHGLSAIADLLVMSYCIYICTYKKHSCKIFLHWKVTIRFTIGSGGCGSWIYDGKCCYVLLGAFIPGVAVQPVCVKYHNSHVSVIISLSSVFVDWMRCNIDLSVCQWVNEWVYQWIKQVEHSLVTSFHLSSPNQPWRRCGCLSFR